MAIRALSPILEEVVERAKACRACPLWEHATQTVFGEGSVGADLMLVGEQPGDKEDLEGHPFVGPAGRVLRESLSEAGGASVKLYVTNAVKHFKWTPSGNRRLHKKPNQSEIHACRPWLMTEIEMVQPKGILLMGVTAAQGLFGKPVKLADLRGRVIESALAAVVIATVHPSALLRIPDQEERHRARAAFVSDIQAIIERLG